MVSRSDLKTLQHIDPRIIYTSLAIIIILALLNHLTRGETYSIATVLLIVFIALGNIGYLYSKS
jgi:hypothetical protein